MADLLSSRMLMYSLRFCCLGVNRISGTTKLHQMAQTQHGIEMKNLGQRDDEEAMLPPIPSVDDDKFNTMSPAEIRLHDQRKSLKLYVNFVVVFILSSIMLFYNFTGTFSCSGDSLTSCYPQFTMNIKNDTEQATSVLHTANECLKMVSFFATSFNSDKNDDFKGIFGSVYNETFSSPETTTDGTGSENRPEIGGSDSVPDTDSGFIPPSAAPPPSKEELERLLELINSMKNTPPGTDPKASESTTGGLDIEEHPDTDAGLKRSRILHVRDVISGVDNVDNDVLTVRKVYGGSNTEEDKQESGISEDHAISLLSILDLFHLTQNSTNSSGIDSFVDQILGSITNVLESKGLLDVIDTLSTSNVFEFNHNGYCRVNKDKKTKFCTFSKGLDIFSVLIQDIGYQLANLVKTDPNELSESMVTTYSSAVVTFNTLYDKGSVNQTGYTDFDMQSLKNVRSLRNAKHFSRFSAHSSWIIIFLSISITLLTGNILLSFTFENIKFFEAIQKHLHQYILKGLLGLISIKTMLEFFILLGEFLAYRRYTRFFSKLEVAKLSYTWGFYFTLFNVLSGAFQIFIIRRVRKDFDQFLR